MAQSSNLRANCGTCSRKVLARPRPSISRQPSSSDRAASSTYPSQIPSQAENIEPLLGDVPRTQDGAATRQISASDTLMNQPQDDLLLQRLVARYLVELVGSADGSDRTARSLSRTTQEMEFHVHLQEFLSSLESPGFHEPSENCYSEHGMARMG